MENIAGWVEVDCGLVLAKFEGFFENFAVREGWTAGFISRKNEDIGFYFGKKATRLTPTDTTFFFNSRAQGHGVK